MVTITLYKRKGSARRLTQDLEVLETINIQNIDRFLDIYNPVFTLKTNDNIEQANYIYILELDRYYYINSKTYSNTDNILLQLSTDYLHLIDYHDITLFNLTDNTIYIDSVTGENYFMNCLDVVIPDDSTLCLNDQNNIISAFSNAILTLEEYNYFELL